MVNGTRCPYESICKCVMLRGAVAPKGPVTYAVLVCDLNLRAGIWVSRLDIGQQALKDPVAYA